MCISDCLTRKCTFVKCRLIGEVAGLACLKILYCFHKAVSTHKMESGGRARLYGCLGPRQTEFQAALYSIAEHSSGKVSLQTL